MTDDEVDLLHLGLRLMRERKELAAALFYPRLFEIAPDTRPLFSDDIIGQTEKTIFACAAVVGQIQEVDREGSLCSELAKRHVAYGVKPQHYPLVGKAVLSIMEEVLGEAHFTPEMEAAWVKAYDRIARAMVRTAYGEEALRAVYREPELVEASALGGLSEPRLNGSSVLLSDLL
jgi:nitric oxide dioxygenase